MKRTVISSGMRKKTLLIDPGDDAHAIVQIIQEYNLQIVAYVCTQRMQITSAHFTRCISSIQPDCYAYLNWDWAFSEINQSPPYYAQPKEPTSYTRMNLDEKKQWTFGPFELEVIHTPGHTPVLAVLYARMKRS